jgi:hypothetical protein
MLLRNVLIAPTHAVGKESPLEDGMVGAARRDHPRLVRGEANVRHVRRVTHVLAELAAWKGNTREDIRFYSRICTDWHLRLPRTFPSTIQELLEVTWTTSDFATRAPFH